jgi:hypothetical protein
MGEAICLDLVVRDGPSRDDARLVRKADLLEKELGVEIRVTVARPVIAQPSPEASGSRLQVVRDKAR